MKSISLILLIVASATISAAAFAAESDEQTPARHSVESVTKIERADVATRIATLVEAGQAKVITPKHIRLMPSSLTKGKFDSSTQLFAVKVSKDSTAPVSKLLAKAKKVSASKGAN